MRFDFTTLYDRHDRDALAVDAAPFGWGEWFKTHEPRFSRIPMWIADMNFATVPSVPAAIARRLEHPLFGYFEPRAEYYQAIIDWQRTQNGVTALMPEHIGYENGVLGGVASALRVLCCRGDKVLVHSPTYVGFTRTLEANGYRIVHSPLVQDAQGVWRMDYEDTERRLREQHIHAAILCSPHNPTGRVWERGELERAMELFRKYDVFVISDEIWSDLTLFGNRHIPTQSISAYLRERMARAAEMSHYNEMNVLSMYGLIGAYSDEGRAWLAELREVLGGNIDLACRTIAERFKGVTVFRPQGTYMLFLDCGAWCAAHGKTMDELLAAGYEAGVLWQDGRAFHGAHHIRLNLALPRSVLEEALDRLDRCVFNA